MKTKKLWARMPTDWIHKDGLREFKWSSKAKSGSNAHKIAALQLYVAIAMTGDHLALPDKEDSVTIRYASDATYNKLQLMTGLSRASVAGGLALLNEQGIIETVKEGRKNYYIPAEYNGKSGWCKVPFRRVVNELGQIVPFQAFKLRRKAELHALKLYLYLCYARPNQSGSTQASYEKINKATAIPEKAIPAAYTVLAGCGLLSHIDKAVEDEESNKNAANAYYLIGYRDLHQHTVNAAVTA